MRTIDATLQAALESGSYSPFFQVTILDSYTGLIHIQAAPVGYKLDDLELTVTVQQPFFLDVPYYRTTVILTRGVTIAGVNYTEDTSDFTIIDSNWDGSFQTFNCNLIPRVRVSAAGDDTYAHVIEAFLARFGFTAAYLEPLADWLNYQFYPAGKSLTLNDARQFFNILKQKYFIFATDNGNNEILFYTPFSHVASPQYAIPGYHFTLDYNVGRKVQYLWRDEIESIHSTSPAFKSMGQISGGAGTILSLIDLGSGVVLAGTLLTYHAHIYRSIDYGETWDAGIDLSTIIGIPTNVNAFLSPAPGIVLAFGMYNGFVVRSADYGVTWAKVVYIGADSTSAPVDLGNGVILVGHTSTPGSGCQVYKSLDYGLTWSLTQALGSEATIYAMAYLGGGVVIAGTGPNGAVYRSTNSGDTWTKVQNLANATQVNSFLPLGGGVVWAGTSTDGRLYKSLDSGATWQEFAHLADGYIYTLSSLGGGILLAATGAGGNIYRSVDNGGTWSVLQQLGAETSARSFLTLGNGSTLAGTSPGGYIYKSLNCSADLDPIHNLGFLPSTAKEPSAYFQLAPAKFDPFPVNLKYQSSDFIRVNLIQGGIYDITCAQVSEVLDLSLKAIPWQMIISPAQWLNNTPVGPLPGTIERVASYTPLVTAHFNKNLSPAINNLQAFADAVDDLVLGAAFPEAPVNSTPYLRQNAGWVSPVAPNIREKLTAARTYYVRTDGNDSHDGLTNSAGGAFLTIQKAVDIACSIDTVVYAVTIQVVSGSYAQIIHLKQWIGGGSMLILGDTATPSNIVLDGNFQSEVYGTVWTVKGFKFTRSSVANQYGCFYCSRGAEIIFSDVEFGAGYLYHLYADTGGIILIAGSYKISSGATCHIMAISSSVVRMNPGATVVVTITGTPAITYFVYVTSDSLIYFPSSAFTFSGSITGTRFLCLQNATIATDAGGLTYLPGTIAGSLASGGIYDSYTAYPGFLDVYPINSVIWRVNNTNPGTIYGGTWSGIGSGTVAGLTVGTSIWIWKRTA